MMASVQLGGWGGSFCRHRARCSAKNHVVGNYVKVSTVVYKRVGYETKHSCSTSCISEYIA